MPGDQILKIHEITSLIKEILESSLPVITVEGEISNYRPSSTGHLYFTLKDESSALQAVMFKGKSRSLGFVPTDGMLVHATGSLSVYAARGSYQLVVDSMSLAGSGDILRLLEDRKRRLAAEGLFDEDSKQTLPFFPQKVVVITSPTGAAVRDIIQVIRRRNPKIDIIILGCPVQGAEAAPELIKAITRANLHSMGDVIIIGRGGGSLEDLLPFSDEDLVRSVAASSIPVVSAVGHEIDWSLCDFAADVRAPTPSAAAELVAPLLDECEGRIQWAGDSLYRDITTRIEKVQLIAQQFSPDSLELRLRRIEQPLLLRFDDAKESLLDALLEKTREYAQRVALLKGILEGANPRTILARGYSLVTDAETGSIIRSSGDTKAGKILRITPQKGHILVHVEET